MVDQISLATSENYACSENPGAHGNIYQRDLAYVLFVRGTLQEYEFKLAEEMTAADKFDDVVMYVRKDHLDETWLFQAKHAKLNQSSPHKILERELFPSEEQLQGKDFDLFKYMNSYRQVEKQISGQKRYFIFSNKDLAVTEYLEKWLQDADVDPMMNFSDFGGVYKVLKLNESNILEFLQMINKTLYDIKNAIVNMFGSGKVDDVLRKYKTPVRELFTCQKMDKDTIIKFSDAFVSTNNDLCRMLLEHYEPEPLSSLSTIVTSEIKSLLDKKNTRSQQLPEFFNKKIVTSFFESLTLCVNQPDELRNIVERDSDEWLRQRVRPDFLGKFGESQLKLPVNKFNEKFKSWHEPRMHWTKDSNRSFLHCEVGTKCLDDIEKDIAQELELSNRLSHFYVNRKVIYTQPPSVLNDQEFISRLVISSNEKKYLILIAGPGMGKTTFMQTVSFEIQKKTSSDVFLIYLNSLKDKLPKSDAVQNLDRALDIIGSALSESKKMHLKKILNDASNDIWFFLDGFDEVPSSEGSTIISVVQQLLKAQRASIVISGREHVANDLRRGMPNQKETEMDARSITGSFKTTDKQKELFAKVIYLQPFAYSDQMTFLEKHWKIPCQDSTKFSKYAEHLLNMYNTKTYSFLEMPLVIKLLAEVYTEDFNDFLQSSDGKARLEALPKEVLSVISLYEQFVRKSFCMKMSKKFNLDPYSKNTTYDDEWDPIFNRYILEHELAAVKLLCSEDGDNDMPFEPKEAYNNIPIESKKVLEQFNERIQAGNEKSLLITFSNSNISFVHQSFAEYFLARHLYKNLKSYSDCLRNILMQWTLVRKFFFMIYEENPNESSHQLSILSNECRRDNLFAFWACEDSCLKVLKSLSKNLELGTFESPLHGSLLHVAAKDGSYEICQFLLEEVKVDVNRTSSENDDDDDDPDDRIEQQMEPEHKGTALHLAAANGHETVVKLLLERSADVNASNANFFTPLHMAAANGHINVMKLLIAHSAELNLETFDEKTPLHFAISRRHVDCVEFLTKLIGAVKIDQKDTKLLHLAAESGKMDILQHIIPLSADMNASVSCDEKISLLYSAVKGGNIDIVKLFIEHLQPKKVHLIRKGFYDISPLHLAAKLSQFEITKLLLPYIANVNERNGAGKTALYIAAKSKAPQIVKLLIDHLADINVVDHSGRTPLHRAAEKGCTETTHLLVDTSTTSVHVQDEDGEAPLHKAVRGNNLEVVRLLIEASADVNVKNIVHSTPLHIAASCNRKEIVKLLLENKADVTAQDHNGETPLDLASSEDRESEVA